MEDHNLPPVFRSADKRADLLQRRHFRLQALELLALVAAATISAFDWRTDSVSFSGLLSFSFLLLAVSIRLTKRLVGHEDGWIRHRALAEATRSIVWRYAVAADPFGTDVSPSTAKEKLRAELSYLPGQDDGPSDHGHTTPWMEELREAGLDRRWREYRTERLAGQLAWYRKRAADSRQAEARWSAIVIAGEGSALCFAGLAALLQVRPGWAGMLGAVAAAAVAWQQSKRFAFLATSYRAAAEQTERFLSSTEVDARSESNWRRFVNEAENSFTAEHQHWYRRHQEDS